MQWSRLNLPEIDGAVQALAVAAARGELDPDRRVEPLTDDALAALADGYRYVDALLEARTDIFVYGQTGHLLELNHRVLCGTSPERRRQFAAHIAETERWFYDRPDGIGEFFDWFRRNATRPPRILAAGIFVQVLSTPQLFIEGNARTATLIVSYVLARAGMAPLVVTADCYRRYLDVTERCCAVDRNGFASGFGIAVTTHRVSGFLQDACDPRFLRQPSHVPAQSDAGRAK